MATSGRLDHEALGVLKAMDVTVFLDKPYTEARLSRALGQLLGQASRRPV